MSFFRSAFRQISVNNSYQVSAFGPRNNTVAATFLPSDIAGLTFWIDPSDVNYVTSSGGFVNSIGNKGSAGGAAQPIDTTSRPLLLTGYVNGKNVASFDGVNDILTSSIGADSIFNANPALTYAACVVLKLNRVNTSDVNPYGLDVIAAEGNASWNINIGTSQGFVERVWHDFGSSDAADYAKSGAGQLTSGSTASVIINYMTKSYDLYLNGSHASSITRTFNPTIVAGSLRIGSETGGSAGNPAKFELCEFMIFTGSLTPVEIGKISTYCSNKWGI